MCEKKELKRLEMMPVAKRYSISDHERQHEFDEKLKRKVMTGYSK